MPSTVLQIQWASLPPVEIQSARPEGCAPSMLVQVVQLWPVLFHSLSDLLGRGFFEVDPSEAVRRGMYGRYAQCVGS